METQEPTTQGTKRRFPPRGKAAKIFILILIISLVGAAGYFYWQYDKVKKDPNAVAREEIKRVTGSVSKFLTLPVDDEPSLATITDIDKLKDQPFFKNAQNGDKLLIYGKTAKAILYRPSENKIVDFTLIDTGSVAGARTTPESEHADNQEAPTPEPVNVVLYNGTTTEGLTRTAENKLSGETGLVVVARENAGKRDYEKTIVVALSASKKDLAGQIASRLGGEVGQLPEGEKAPGNAEIIVILGKDFVQ